MKNDFSNDLLEKIKLKKAKIGIFGLGYVGLPLSLRFSEKGFKVFGFDIDKVKINALKKNKSYIGHISSTKIKTANKNNFQVSDNFELVTECDVLIICVPTPLGKYKEPNLNFVLDTLENIKEYLKKGQILSLESTTYPGTTEEEILPRINKKGFSVGKDFFLVYSPEREDPGNLIFKTNEIPKIIGGHTKNCLKIGSMLYGEVIDKVVKVSDTKTAEMTKLLENIHRAVNIGLANEMKIVSDKMGIDIFEVINAASTKPFGFTPYFPGPGLGGHCIPIDPFYLTWKAKEYGLHTRFIELSGEINASMPNYVVSKINDGLNNIKKSIKDSKILILGLAYKKNIEDLRESPSVKILDLLTKSKSYVNYHDPLVPTFPKMRDYNFDLSSVDLNKKSIKKYDAVVIATDHDFFDYEMILQEAKLIVDCRGVYKTKNKKIIKA